MLLIVTRDGHAKRVSSDDVPRRRRNGGRAHGVRLSSVPVAAVFGVEDGEVIIASARGKIVRMAVGDIPTRRRRVTRGKLSSGPRVIRLARGDRVASVAIVPEHVPQSHADGIVEPIWPWGRVGLRDGEELAQKVILHRPRSLDSMTTGGRPVVARDEWAQTSVHESSAYYCAHCHHPHVDPLAVYECIDRHVDVAQSHAKRLLDEVVGDRPMPMRRGRRVPRRGH